MKKKKVEQSLHSITFKSEEQEKEFEALYKLHWAYVFKYEVGYPDDFKPDDKPNYGNHTDRDTFYESLQDDGMMVKVLDGY